jgi:hypothetical protein
LDLIIVDDQTFSRIEMTALQKILDGRQIRIPDVPRLIALKLHATRDATRRTIEADWQDIVGLVLAANLTLEDPELQAIVSRYGGTGALAQIKSRISSF